MDTSTSKDEPPQAVKAIYATTSVNADICLYEGPVRLRHNQDAFDGTGSVSVTWFPSPRIRVRASFDCDIGIKLLDGNSSLQLMEHPQTPIVDARVTQVHISGSNDIAGVIEHWLHQPHAPVEQVVFHIPNLRAYRGEPVRDDQRFWTGRAEFCADDWQVVIDEIHDPGLRKNLAGIGGFGITHVGRVAKRDKRLFSLAEAQPLLEGLSWILSFCNGRWTGPILPVGQDQDERGTSAEWSMPRVTPCRQVDSWFSDLHRLIISEVFPGFWCRWRSAVSQHVVRSTVYWYMLANAPGVAIENGLVLAQMAFEGIGWFLLVEESKSLSPRRYERMRAAEKLSRMLSQCNIPLGIPSELKALVSAAKSQDWDNGPHAVTAIRNAHVHSNPRNLERLQKAGIDAEGEAWVLSMHYIELLLLKIFDFNGDFSSRLVRGGFVWDAVRKVPWNDGTVSDVELPRE